MRSSPQTDVACPFCLWALHDESERHAEQQVVVCPICETAYHADCWAESGGCATFGCQSWIDRQDVSNVADRPARTTQLGLTSRTTPVPPAAPRAIPAPRPPSSRPRRLDTEQLTSATTPIGPMVGRGHTAAVCPECGFVISFGASKCPYCWAEIAWRDS